MAEAITGSVEIKRSNGDSPGVQGTNWTVDSVPMVLGVLHGITGMVAVEPVDPREPERQEGGPVLEAQWTGKDRNAQDVTVYLWREVPHDQTYAAQIGPALAEQQGGE